MLWIMNQVFPRDPGKIRPGLFPNSLRTRMFLGFGLLFIISFITLRAIERFGLPFSGYNGLVEERRSEVFRGLELTADLKKERLTKWVEERKDDSVILAASPLMQSQVARLRAAIEDLRAEGRQDEALWEAVADTGVYRCQ
jgi:hypothetical protein